jgi:hypothetical protein
MKPRAKKQSMSKPEIDTPFIQAIKSNVHRIDLCGTILKKQSNQASLQILSAASAL